ncbi:MAG TPA: hypothetical protein VGQ41_19655 [Pyrinomonadaceae bacterium]|jgi:hypothetical protein|nr:hypothetical protein [Pyrinomonadaceae bacterium]
MKSTAQLKPVTGQFEYVSRKGAKATAKEVRDFFASFAPLREKLFKLTQYY